MSEVEEGNVRRQPPVKWRDRVQKYVRGRGEGSLRSLEQARRECQDRERWKLFCHGHPLVGSSRSRRQNELNQPFYTCAICKVSPLHHCLSCSSYIFLMDLLGVVVNMPGYKFRGPYLKSGQLALSHSAVYTFLLGLSRNGYLGTVNRRGYKGGAQGPRACV